MGASSLGLFEFCKTTHNVVIVDVSRRAVRVVRTAARRVGRYLRQIEVEHSTTRRRRLRVPAAARELRLRSGPGSSTEARTHAEAWSTAGWRRVHARSISARLWETGVHAHNWPSVCPRELVGRQRSVLRRHETSSRRRRGVASRRHHQRRVAVHAFAGSSTELRWILHRRAHRGR